MFLAPSRATRLLDGREHDAGVALIAAGLVHPIGVIFNGRWRLSPAVCILGISVHLRIMCAYCLGVALIALETGAASPMRATQEEDTRGVELSREQGKTARLLAILNWERKEGSIDTMGFISQ